MNCSAARATSATPCPPAMPKRINRYGLGMAEHEDLVWLTSHNHGDVVFHGTARQLRDSDALMSGLTPNQRALVSVYASNTLQ